MLVGGAMVGGVVVVVAAAGRVELVVVWIKMK